MHINYLNDVQLNKTTTTIDNNNKHTAFAGKVDYSNQILLTSDDWEVDCRKLKFASHIGQGAFGKVVTGYYDDAKVAIKLIRGKQCSLLDLINAVNTVSILEQEHQEPVVQN